MANVTIKYDVLFINKILGTLLWYTRNKTVQKNNELQGCNSKLLVVASHCPIVVIFPITA